MKSNSLYLETVERLTRLSETDLQRKIIEPLLRSEGFTSVRETGGPNDKGKDLVAIKEDFGKPKVYAIQIKKFKFSGKHNSQKGLANVITQLKQVFAEPIKDPLIRTERCADRCIFITPFEIDRNALESAFHALAELERKEITIIDGPILVDMITKHMPSAFSAFDMELHYRYRLAEAVNLIPESKAFGLSKELELRNIYVEIRLADRRLGVMEIARSNPCLPQKIVYGTQSDYEKLRAQCSYWNHHQKIFVDIAGNEQIGSVVLETKQYIANKRSEIESRLHLVTEILKEQKEKNVKSDADIETTDKYQNEEKSLNDDLRYWSALEVRCVDISGVVEAIRRAAAVLAESFAQRNIVSKPIDRGNEIFQKLIKLTGKIDDFITLSVIKTFWPNIWDGASKIAPQEFQINAEMLLKLRLPIFIQGGAGAGKTTLLRHLCQQHALKIRRGDTPIPILISLIRSKIKSQMDVIEQCLKQLRELGYQITESQFKSSLEEGSFAILFDGLDETGDKSELVFSVIKSLARKYNGLAIMVTGRDTYYYSRWAEAIQLRVAPFTIERLAMFIQNWFTSEPSKVESVMSWLSTNQQMGQAACTPIIAALLCSLVDAGADLPDTNVELYEQRFELLLGRWENAKGLNTMSATLRKRYWRFITSIAFDMHLGARRTILYSELIDKANMYFDIRYHANADNFVTDCVHRGLLLHESDKYLSFGHLTYQEFLVAKHLANDGSHEFLTDRIDQPWWSKVMEFYAALKGDLTMLVKHALGPTRPERYLNALLELCSQASLTPASTRNIIVSRLDELRQCIAR